MHVTLLVKVIHFYYSLILMCNYFQKSLSHPVTSSLGTLESLGNWSKFVVSEAPWTVGTMGGFKLRSSKPDQSNP